MGVYDFPIACLVELEREEKVGVESIGHFAGVVSMRDDLVVAGVEQTRLSVDPSVSFGGSPNVAQV